MNSLDFAKLYLDLSSSDPEVLLSKSCKYLFCLSYIVCTSRYYHGIQYHLPPKTEETSPGRRWHFLYKELLLPGSYVNYLIDCLSLWPSTDDFQDSQVISACFSDSQNKCSYSYRLTYIWDTWKIIYAHFFEVHRELVSQVSWYHTPIP